MNGDCKHKLLIFDTQYRQWGFRTSLWEAREDSLDSSFVFQVILWALF